MYFLYILFAILIFGILIMVHELGHFLTAKLFKVKVNEFSIFMGPAIWKRQRGRPCIPSGASPWAVTAPWRGGREQRRPRAFGNAKWWQRIIILFAGAGMNFWWAF